MTRVVDTAQLGYPQLSIAVVSHANPIMNTENIHKLNFEEETFLSWNLTTHEKNTIF